MIALSRGISIITATFATSTGNFFAFVDDATVNITAVSISYSSSTLAGLMGARASASVGVKFSDGSSIADAVSTFSPLSALLGFNSSDPDFVNVSSMGEAELLNNSWRFAIITVYSQCSDGSSDSFAISGNIEPDTYDTKLGHSAGLTFPPAAFGHIVDSSIQVIQNFNLDFQSFVVKNDYSKSKFILNFIFR